MIFIPGNAACAHQQSCSVRHSNSSDSLNFYTYLDSSQRILLTGNNDVFSSVAQFQNFAPLQPAQFPTLSLYPWQKYMDTDNSCRDTAQKLSRLAKVRCDTTKSHSDTSWQFYLNYPRVLAGEDPDWRLFAVQLNKDGIYLYYAYQDEDLHEVIHLDPRQLQVGGTFEFQVYMPMTKLAPEQINGIQLNQLPLRSVHIDMSHHVEAHQPCYSYWLHSKVPEFVDLAGSVQTLIGAECHNAKQAEQYWAELIQPYLCRYLDLKFTYSEACPHPLQATLSYIFTRLDGQPTLTSKVLKQWLDPLPLILTNSLGLDFGTTETIRERINRGWNVEL